MDGETYISKFLYVDVTIAPKFRGVLAKERHQANCRLQQSFRENLKVKRLRLERGTSFGVERSVICIGKGKHRGFVDMDMVGMFISANGIKRQNNFWFEVADIFHNAPRHFVNGSIDLRIGMLDLLPCQACLNHDNQERKLPSSQVPLRRA